MAKWLLPVLATITLHPAHFAHRTTLASGHTGPNVWRIWASDGKKFGPELNLCIGADWGPASGPPPQVDPYPYCNPGGTPSFNPNGVRYSLHSDGLTGIVNATTGNGAVRGIPAFRLMILLVDRRARRVTVRMWDGSGAVVGTLSESRPPRKS